MEVEARPMVVLKDFIGILAFLPGEKAKRVEELVAGRRSSGGAFCFIQEENEDEEVEVVDSSESSSIGPESSSEDDDRGGGDDEADSKGPLGSLDSLEESLPIKRGLSNYFTGKSKSFASLSDVAVTASARELAKPENPFNKRRRILLAAKSSWTRRASYSSLLPPLPPLMAEEDEEEDDDDEDEDETIRGFPPLPLFHRKKNERGVMKKAFRSPRSFSLSDLQHA